MDYDIQCGDRNRTLRKYSESIKKALDNTEVIVRIYKAAKYKNKGNLVEKEKKEFSLWWLIVLGLIVITGGVFTVMKIGGTAAERLIFENSYQKVAGDKKQLNTWRAQLAAINLKLMSAPDNENLRAQKAMLEVQIGGLK